MIRMILLTVLVALCGCQSAKFEAGEVTAPGVHLKDVKGEVEAKPAATPKPSERPE